MVGVLSWEELQEKLRAVVTPGKGVVKLVRSLVQAGIHQNIQITGYPWDPLGKQQLKIKLTL